ncbi:tetratricopeptide repeat protein [uncultured Sphingomonas sp.]|uniref:tetratricopeptide repeat protein n=1 Tax=uncultured Sphingomonas sp. TaxID=158754 RepID=UPI0035C97151
MTARMRVELPGDLKAYTLDGDSTVPAPLGATTIRRTVTQAGGAVEAVDQVSATGAEIAPGDVAAMRAKVALAKSRLLTLIAPADLPPRWRLVQDARATGALKTILAAYADAISADPDNVDAYVNRANFLSGIYDWKAALPDLDRAVALAPTADRYLSRATAEQIAGLDAKAFVDLEAAHRLEPASPDDLDQLGRYLIAHGQKDQALALVQEQIDAGGTAKAAMVSRKASLLALAGDRDAALAAVDQAVALKPGDPSLLNERCWLKAQLAIQLDTALKDCTKAIELSDATGAALDSRALVYFRLNRFDDALADLGAALEQNPDQAGSLYLRGIIYSHQNKAADARRDLDAAIFMAPRIATNYKPFGIAP